MTTGFVIVQEHDFDCSELQQALLAKDYSDGAVCSFVGFVRADKGGDDFQSMVLEHYEGMTQSSIERIIDQAVERWDIHCAGVVHRVGKLLPGEQIVWVGVASGHREAAFNACEYIMDYLKTDAPIWKKRVGNGMRSGWLRKLAIQCDVSIGATTNLSYPIARMGDARSLKKRCYKALWRAL